MKVILKGFVPEDTKSYCNNKPLTSGKAFYMVDNSGAIYYGGRRCAEIHAITDLTKVPDVTKALVSMNDGVAGSGGGNGSSQKIDDTKHALSYLMLREEQLKGFSFVSPKNKLQVQLTYAPLQKYYAKLKQTGSLNDAEIQHITNIEKKSVNTYGNVLSTKNLMACCAYNFILDRMLAHMSGSSPYKAFIIGLKNYLKTHCDLTDSQIDKMKQCLLYLPEELKKSKLLDFDK